MVLTGRILHHRHCSHRLALSKKELNTRYCDVSSRRASRREANADFVVFQRWPLAIPSCRLTDFSGGIRTDRYGIQIFRDRRASRSDDRYIRGQQVAKMTCPTGSQTTTSRMLTKVLLQCHSSQLMIAGVLQFTAIANCSSFRIRNWSTANKVWSICTKMARTSLSVKGRWTWTDKRDAPASGKHGRNFFRIQ